MMYVVVLTFESVDEIIKCDIEMKATEHHFVVVMFVVHCFSLFSVPHLGRDYTNFHFGTSYSPRLQFSS